ncbi:hypothetical protein PSAB6_430052 [Paraburkholderia sabiae]|nr:hypothetical protein PSAB6_430052 [Paraburkholderia sabiae]
MRAKSLPSRSCVRCSPCSRRRIPRRRSCRARPDRRTSSTDPSGTGRCGRFRPHAARSLSPQTTRRCRAASRSLHQAGTANRASCSSVCLQEFVTGGLRVASAVASSYVHQGIFLSRAQPAAPRDRQDPVRNRRFIRHKPARDGIERISLQIYVSVNRYF